MLVAPLIRSVVTTEDTTYPVSIHLPQLANIGMHPLTQPQTHYLLESQTPRQPDVAGSCPPYRKSMNSTATNGWIAVLKNQRKGQP